MQEKSARPQQRKKPNVLHQHRIHGNFTEKLCEFQCSRHLFFLDQRVYRHIYLNSAGVTKSNCPPQLFPAKILCICPGPKRLSPQIDGIRPGKHGGAQRIFPARRCQDLNFTAADSLSSSLQIYPALFFLEEAHQALLLHLLVPQGVPHLFLR